MYIHKILHTQKEKIYTYNSNNVNKCLAKIIISVVLIFTLISYQKELDLSFNKLHLMSFPYQLAVNKSSVLHLFFFILFSYSKFVCVHFFVKSNILNVT